MTTQEMIDLIRAGRAALSHRVLHEIADRLEDQDAHLRSALRTLHSQEEQLRSMGGELVEEVRYRKVLTTQFQELLDRCEMLEIALAGAEDVG